MERCRYCEVTGGRHLPGCPDEHFPATPLSAEDIQRTARLHEWKSGYNDGRASKRPVSESQTYMIGWRLGDSAADEAANGCQSWGG
jgi:hypothetical protein